MTKFDSYGKEEQQEVVDTFYDLFAGRLDTYAIRVEFRVDGEDKAAYMPSVYTGDKEYVRDKIAAVVRAIGTPEFGPEAIRAHFAGKELLGVYPITPENTVRWFALDFDGKDGDPWQAALTQATVLAQEAGLAVYIERSQSGNGYHVWGFLNGAINAGKLRHALSPYIEKVATFDRMFPNQNGLSATRPLGNLIALPLHGGRMAKGNSSFVKRGTDGAPIPYENQYAFLSTIKLNDVGRIEEMFVEAGQYAPEVEATKHDGDTEGLADSWKLTHPRFGCEFWRFGLEHPEDVTEPMWYAMACNLAKFEDGRALFHQWSRADSTRYSKRQTDKKFDQAVKMNAPHSCETIRGLGGNCTCDQRFPGVVYHPFDLAKIPFKKLVEAIGVEGDLAHHIITVEEGLDDAILRLEQIEKDPEAGQGRRYGIKSIDAATRQRNSDLVIIAARPGMGKALSEDSKILTPSGWVRMGDIALGDTVIGGDGQPCRVTGVYPQGSVPLYRVTFDDGASVECCDEHLWFTTTRADRRVGAPGAVKSLAEIRETLRVGGTEQRVNHQIPWMAPAALHTDGERPLAPYLLGALLGDGSFHKQIRLHNPEPSVVAAVSGLLPSGDRLVGAGKEWRVISGNRRSSATRRAVESLGLMAHRAWEKFIPDVYLHAPIADRLALLRGLFDTDGHVTGTVVEYTTTSGRLAEDVQFLVGSLGGRVTTTTRTPTYRYKGDRREGRTSYRLVCSFRNGLVPVSSAKHADKYRATERVEGRGIVSVEAVGVKPAQCIRVDNRDRLYVTDNFIVTHNTAFAGSAMDYGARNNEPQYFFSAEMAHKQFWMRQLSVIAEVSQTRMVTGQLTSGDWAKIRNARNIAKDKESYPIFVDDMSRSTERIFEVAAKLIHQHGKGTIWIDYLQLLQRLPRESMFDAVTRITHDLKMLAKALDVCVIALTQLNRTADDATPDSQTSDAWLRGSGDIEQAADVIIFLLGEKGPGVKDREAALHKERHREAGIRIPLSFNQAIMRFAERGTWSESDKPARRPMPTVGEKGPDPVAESARDMEERMREYVRTRDAGLQEQPPEPDLLDAHDI